MEDKTFTNEDNIKYPSLEDIADIRVINNNIKILDEKKLTKDEISSFLQGVAKETSPHNIQNIVNENKSKLSTINSGLSIINNKVSDINSSISSNLNGVAKESSVQKILNRIGDEIKPVSIFDMPNLSIKEVSKSNAGRLEVVNVSGKGILAGATFKPYKINDGERSRFIVEIDGKNIINLEVINQAFKTISNYGQWGILNYGLQNYSGYSGGGTPSYVAFCPIKCFEIPTGSFLFEKTGTIKLTSGFDNFTCYGIIITSIGIPFNNSLKIIADGNISTNCSYAYCITGR